MRLITLNGVKLLVYLNGMILRYSDKEYPNLIKGWSEVKGYINNKGYLVIRLNGKDYKKHRIVGYAFLGLDINNPKQQIDHIDRNKQNNNMNNLRIVSHQENQFNKVSNGYTIRGNKYQVRIKLNHQETHIGTFDTEEEARNAYLQAKEKYHIIPVILN